MQDWLKLSNDGTVYCCLGLLFLISSLLLSFTQWKLWTSSSYPEAHFRPLMHPKETQIDAKSFRRQCRSLLTDSCRSNTKGITYYDMEWDFSEILLFNPVLPVAACVLIPVLSIPKPLFPQSPDFASLPTLPSSLLPLLLPFQTPLCPSGVPQSISQIQNLFLLSLTLIPSYSVGVGGKDLP